MKHTLDLPPLLDTLSADPLTCAETGQWRTSCPCADCRKFRTEAPTPLCIRCGEPALKHGDRQFRLCGDCGLANLNAFLAAADIEAETPITVGAASPLLAEPDPREDAPCSQPSGHQWMFCHSPSTANGLSRFCLVCGAQDPTLTASDHANYYDTWTPADGDDTDMDADDYDLCPACNGTGGGDDGSCARCGGDGEIKR